MPVSFLLPGERQKGLEGDGPRTQLSFWGGVTRQGGPRGGERILEAPGRGGGDAACRGRPWVCPAWPLSPCVAVGEP